MAKVQQYKKEEGWCGCGPHCPKDCKCCAEARGDEEEAAAHMVARQGFTVVRLPGVNQPVRDLELGQYINRAMRYVDEGDEIPLYFTSVCRECLSSHCKHSLRYNGVILIGCEGYWHINPEVLDLPKGQWSDWTEVTNG